MKTQTVVTSVRLLVAGSLALVAMYSFTLGGWFFVHQKIAGAGEQVAVVLKGEPPLAAPISGKPVCAYHFCVMFPGRGSACGKEVVADYVVEVAGEPRSFRRYPQDGDPFDRRAGETWRHETPMPVRVVEEWPQTFTTDAETCEQYATCRVEEFVTLCGEHTVRVDEQAWGSYLRPLGEPRKTLTVAASIQAFIISALLALIVFPKRRKRGAELDSVKDSQD